jgi:hypothetical protein
MQVKITMGGTFIRGIILEAGIKSLRVIGDSRITVKIKII